MEIQARNVFNISRISSGRIAFFTGGSTNEIRRKVYLSQYLTNLMHKICFTVSFISCLYMFRTHVHIIRRSKLHYTASGINQLDAQNLFHSKFNSCLYMFRTHMLIIRRSKLHYTASGIDQLDAQNLFHSKFYFMPLHVSNTCAHHQEVKIALHILWY